VVNVKVKTICTLANSIYIQPFRKSTRPIAILHINYPTLRLNFSTTNHNNS
jgi:hypothetical protein